jgi:hypothetical protein
MAAPNLSSPLLLNDVTHHRPTPPRFNFARVVGHAQLQRKAAAAAKAVGAGGQKQHQPLKGAGAFRAAAFSVLSPANREDAINQTKTLFWCLLRDRCFFSLPKRNSSRKILCDNAS